VGREGVGPAEQQIEGTGPVWGGQVVQALFEQTQWDTLCDNIRAGECTPFLGAGVSLPALPTGGQLARELAQKNDYPLVDEGNLARVGQYVATTHRSPVSAKRQVARMIEERQLEFHPEPDDPHKLLASLNLPIYVTTNWDSLMVRALQAQGRDATQELARWNEEVRTKAGKFRAVSPTADQPLVYHLHGHTNQIPSMVLTEDDYVEYVTELARNLKEVVPPRIQEALTWTSLLFVGYSLTDWNFHVLLRLLMSSLVSTSTLRRGVSIQVPNKDMIAEGREDDAKQFIADYLGSNVDIHWVEAQPFLVELRDRCAGHDGNR
jgi:hypothetical protein